ncbi:MAG: hypothetical protein QNJ55_09815 [Xenococcus sp. MO_188.B8]|nr:hypothetical protein [Xenococcus sp. MO_188.B8]
MMQKYLLLCLIAAGFFTRVSLANAQSTITKENSNLEPQNQIEFSGYSSAKNLLISQEIEVDTPEGVELKTKPLIVPADQGQTITDIQVRFVDRNNQPVEGKLNPGKSFLQSNQHQKIY